MRISPYPPAPHQENHRSTERQGKTDESEKEADVGSSQHSSQRSHGTDTHRKHAKTCKQIKAISLTLSQELLLLWQQIRRRHILLLTVIVFVLGPSERLNHLQVLLVTDPVLLFAGRAIEIQR